MDPQPHSTIPSPDYSSCCEHLQFISPQDSSKAEASDFGELSSCDSKDGVSKFACIQVNEWNNAHSIPTQPCCQQTQTNNCFSKPAVSTQVELASSGLDQSNTLNVADSNTQYPENSDISRRGSFRRQFRQDVIEEGPFKKPRFAYRGEDDIRWLKREVMNIKWVLEKMAIEAGEDREHIMLALTLLQMDKDAENDDDSEP